MTSTIHQHAASSHQSLQHQPQPQSQQQQQHQDQNSHKTRMAINSASIEQQVKAPVVAPPRLRHVHSSLASTSSGPNSSTACGPATLAAHYDGQANSSKGGPQRGHQRRQSVARLLPDISKLRLLSWLVEASSEMINCDIAIMDGVYAKLNHSQESLLFWSPHPTSSNLLASAQSIDSNSSSASLRTLLAHEHDCGLKQLPLASGTGKGRASGIQTVENFENLSLGVATPKHLDGDSSSQTGQSSSVGQPASKPVKLSKKQLKQQRKLQEKRDKLSVPIVSHDDSPTSSTPPAPSGVPPTQLAATMTNKSQQQQLQRQTNQDVGPSSSSSCHKSVSSPMIVTSSASSPNSPAESSTSSSASSTSSFVSGATTDDSASSSVGSTPTSSSPPTMYDSPLGELQIVSECSMDSSVSSSSHSPTSPNHHLGCHRRANDHHQDNDNDDNRVGEDVDDASISVTRSNIGAGGSASALLLRNQPRKSASLLRNQRLFSVAASQQARNNDDQHYPKSASFDATTLSRYENDAQSHHDGAEDQGFEEDYLCDDDSYSSSHLLSSDSGSVDRQQQQQQRQQAWSPTRHQHLMVAGRQVDHTSLFASSTSVCGSLRDLTSLHNQSKHYQSSSSLSLSQVSQAASQHSAPSALLSQLAQSKLCQCYADGRSTPRTNRRAHQQERPIDNQRGPIQSLPMNAATLSDIIRQIVMDHGKLSRLLQSIIARYDTEKMLIMSSNNDNSNNNNCSSALAPSEGAATGCQSGQHNHLGGHHRIDISAIVAALDECSCMCHHSHVSHNAMATNHQQQQQQQLQSDNGLDSVVSICDHHHQGDTGRSGAETPGQSGKPTPVKRPKRFKGKAKKQHHQAEQADEEPPVRWCENCSENHFEAWFESVAAANDNSTGHGRQANNNNNNNNNIDKQQLNVSQKNANLIKLIQQEVRSTLLKSIELIDLIRKQIKSPESIQQKHLLRCFANSIHLLTSVGCYVMPAQDVFNHFNQLISSNNTNNSTTGTGATQASNCCPLGSLIGGCQLHAGATGPTSHHHPHSQHQASGGGGGHHHHVAQNGLFRLPSSDFEPTLIMGAPGQSTGGNCANDHSTNSSQATPSDQWPPHLARDRQNSHSMRLKNPAGASTKTNAGAGLQLHPPPPTTRYAHHLHHLYQPTNLLSSSLSPSNTMNHGHQPLASYYHTQMAQAMSSSSLSSSSPSSPSSAYSSLCFSPAPPRSMFSYQHKQQHHYGVNACSMQQGGPYQRASWHNHSSSSCSSGSPSSSPSSSYVASPQSGYHHHHHYQPPSMSAAAAASSSSSSSYCYVHHPYINISSSVSRNAPSCRSSATFAGSSTYYGPNQNLPVHSATIGSALGMSPLTDTSFLGSGLGAHSTGSSTQNSGLKFWQSPKFNFIRKIWHVRRQRLMRQQSKDRKLYNTKIQNKLKLVIGDYVHFHKSQTLLNTENGINSLCTSMRNALEFGLYLSQKLY